MVCGLGQDDSPGQGVLEERYPVKKKEGATSDLGVGSFPLDSKGCLVPGVYGRCQWRSWRRVSKVAPVSRF